jgi:Ca-activated chloride channel family protein
MKKIGILIFITALFSVNADNIAITGIDSTGILRTQKVNLYITRTNNQGEPADPVEDISVFESPNGDDWVPVDDIVVDREANRREGIGFLLLLDNSGSMYDNLEGKADDNQENQRMTHAKKALITFLNSMEDSRDRVALISFNTDYTPLTESTRNISALINAMDSVTKPEPEKAYTELYSSLERSSRFFSDGSEKGRKIIVVLSDGENYPFYQYNGGLHPEYGDRLFSPEEASQSLNKEGVTLFAIHFGLKQDPFLGEIARNTGGQVFDARNGDELAQVYGRIRESVMNEYRITYRAGVYSSNRVFVKIASSPIESKARYYYNSALFGQPGGMALIFLVLILLAAVGLWLLLTKIRLERVNASPHIELIGAGGLRNRVLELNDGKTIIGTSESHDMTIAGKKGASEKEAATIIYDEKKQAFTLVAGEGESTMVNNQEVSQKELKAGDVIKVGDSLIIFDDEGTQIK